MLSLNATECSNVYLRSKVSFCQEEKQSLKFCLFCTGAVYCLGEEQGSSLVVLLLFFYIIRSFFVWTDVFEG